MSACTISAERAETSNSKRRIFMGWPLLCNFQAIVCDIAHSRFGPHLTGEYTANYLRLMRAGIKTVASAAMKSSNATYSRHSGDSPSTHIPLNTPTTGIIKVLSEDTLGGAVVAILNHAQ